MRKLLNEELGRLSVEEYQKIPKLEIVIVLDNIRSLNNIGSVFRTSDAFRLEAIYLCGITATPPHREIHKTALGATDSVLWEHYEDTLNAVKELKQRGYRIIAIEQAEGSTLLQDFKPKSDEKLAFIFGNEINGVGEEIMTEVNDCVEIPQFGTKHSINISVSVGIVIWDVINKQGMA